MNEEEILHTLDNANDGYYCSFVDLGNGYSYLIDTRLNVFYAGNRWAIAIERLGYNPRAGAILLDIYYYGNCLKNLEYYNERPTNYYSVLPIDTDNFNQTVELEHLRNDAKYWLVRGQKIGLSQNKQEYLDKGIELKYIDRGQIRVEEACRLVISKNPELFRANDVELYKSIPSDLTKMLVLDEWYHKDFTMFVFPAMTDEDLRYAWETNKRTGLEEGSFEDFVGSFRQQELLQNEWNKEKRKNDRPGSYETWQLIAKVISKQDVTQYKPTIDPNTHWTNWPASGNM